MQAQNTKNITQGYDTHVVDWSGQRAIRQGTDDIVGRIARKPRVASSGQVRSSSGSHLGQRLVSSSSHAHLPILSLVFPRI